jgi:hypothetical protein
MLMHSDLMLTLANERHRELIAEADRAHLLRGARAARRSRQTSESAVVRGQPTVAVPAH